MCNWATVVKFQLKCWWCLLLCLYSFKGWGRATKCITYEQIHFRSYFPVPSELALDSHVFPLLGLLRRPVVARLGEGELVKTHLCLLLRSVQVVCLFVFLMMRVEVGCLFVCLLWWVQFFTWAAAELIETDRRRQWRQIPFLK